MGARRFRSLVVALPPEAAVWRAASKPEAPVTRSFAVDPSRNLAFAQKYGRAKSGT